MSIPSLSLSNKDQSVVLELLVQPRSRKSEWGEVADDGRIKLKIKAPPVDGAANKACIKFISKYLRTVQKNVVLLIGEKSRRKTIRVTGYDSDRLAALVDQLKNLSSDSSKSPVK